jgi:hypothetical protein
MIQIKKKTRNILLITLGVIVLILALLPTIIKNYAVNNSAELVGRKIEIGKLKYNYFSSTLEVHDFKMLEQNERDNFTTFDTLIINLAPYRLISNEKVIEQFYIGGLMVKTVMKDSTFNFDDLIAFHATETDSVAESEADLFKYEISNIELNKANFFFNNENVNKETHIEDFSFLIPFIGWNQEEKSNADIKFNFKRGGYFESILNINPVSGDFDAHFIIDQLYLDDFLNYVKPYAEINSFYGVLNSKIDVFGNTNEAINSIISGEVTINDFKMTDLNDKEFLSAKYIQSNLEKIDYANSNYVIKSLDISDSYAFFELDSVTNNFFEIFKLNAPDSTTVVLDSIPNDNAAVETISYAINKLSVNNGVLDYTDNLTGEPFKYHLSHIEIDSDSINSTTDWLDINATMLLNNRGTLKAELGINPNNYANSTLDISIEKFLLPDLNMYTNYYMGHSILEGDMYYYSQSKIVDGNITSENRLLVKNASLENVKGGLYDLPLKFAFFLLTDKNGDVNLELPVRGNMNDPDYDVRKIIWQTFKNVIGKTVASPVNFLVGLVGGDPKELEEIQFTFQDTIPSDKHYKQFDKLLKLEQQKPDLQIEFNYYVDKNLQREALAMEHAVELFKQKTRKDFTIEDKKFQEFVFKKADVDSLNLEEAIMRLTNQTQLDSLANLRDGRIIKITEDYLKEASFSTKIKIKKSDTEAPENTGAYPKFLITYGMLDDNITSKQTDTIP